MTHLLQKLKDKFRSSHSPFVPDLGFGGGALSGEGGGYGFGPLSDSEADELLDHAKNYGIWLYDTAPIYGFGKSEERLGGHFKKCREKICLVSKGGVTWHSNKRVNMSNDPKIIESMLEASMRSLQTDYIDIYMIHWPDPKVDIRRTLEVLAKAKDQGKINHVGLCNTNFDEIKKAQEIIPIEVVQSEFNIWSNLEQQKFVEQLHSQNISFMSWGTLDKGILAGSVDEKRVFHQDDCRSWAPWWTKEKKDWKYKVIENLKKDILPHFFPGISLSLGPISSALFFNLQNGVDLLLAGPKSDVQLKSLLSALLEIDQLTNKEELNDAIKEIVRQNRTL